MDKKQTELLEAKLLPTQEEEVPTNPQSRKRQFNCERDSNNGNDRPQLKRARLTRKNLARFTKMGKDKKKESKKSLSSSSYRHSMNDSKSTISTTSSGFAVQARKNGILDPIGSKPPANLEDIRAQYARSRTTVSPTESEYKRYARKVARVPNEATMVYETGGKLLKDHGEDGYNRSFNQPFTGFPDDVGFNNALSAPQPDYVEGLEMEEYDPFPIDEQINGAVLYKDNPRSLTLSHMAGEWKGPKGGIKEAELQSAYDGASLVYARNQALSYLRKPDPPGHAQVTTFTTDGTTLNQYAHYAEESKEGTTKYHQYRVKSTNLINSYQEFNDGRRSLRNAQDHAKNQSYALRDGLKEHWEQQRHDTIQPIAEGESSASLLPGHDTSTYETDLDHQASYKADTQVQETIHYEVVDQPSSSKRQSSRHSSSKSSSKSSHHSGGHKRKASQPSPLGSGSTSKQSNKRKED